MYKIKSGDFFSINNYLFLVIEYEEKDKYFCLTYKDMKNGRIRKESYYFDYINHIKLEELKYLKEDNNNYIFINNLNNLIFIDKKILTEEIDKIKNHKEIESKHKVSPVYINTNIIINGKTLISLNTKTENSEIYYTLNGTNPNKKSLKYKTPIKIDKNETLKAIAYKTDFVKSVITSYDFLINKNKKPIIYLSPSNQIQNLGIKDSGYTNEGEMMNKLCDILEQKLKKCNFLVYRNNPKERTWDNPYEKVAKWGNESKNLNADLHLALHSNGSSLHNKKGIEVWIDNENSNMYSLATKLMDNLHDIYYDKNNVITYRGVKYGLGFIEEVRPKVAYNAVLMEIGYHDNKEDAIWMTNNLEKIADNIFESLKKYFYM